MKEYNYKCTCTAKYTAIMDEKGNRVSIKQVDDDTGQLVENHDCICRYCRQRVTPKNIYEAKKATDNGNSKKLRRAILSRKQNLAVNPEDSASHLAIGLFLLRQGGYSDARVHFKKAIDLDPRNPNGYFYSCIALLSGTYPCRQESGKIKLIEERLNICEGLAEDDANKARYLFFHSFIKYDYYAKSYLRTSPTYQEYLSEALGCGLTREDKDTLFSLLKVPMPSCLL